MSNTKQSAFTKHMIRKAGTVKQARKSKPNDFEVRLPEGDYVATLAETKFNEDKNGNPFVQFQFVVTHPRETAEGVKVGGKQAYVSHFLSASDWNTEEESFERFFHDCQRMGVETESMPPDVIEEEVAALSEKQTSVRIEIAKSKRGRKFVRIKGLASEEDANNASVEQSGERTAADVMDEMELDEQETLPPGEDWEPQVGDMYEYRTSARGRMSGWEVIDVNYDDAMMTLRRESDGNESEIPWDDPNLGNQLS